MNRTTGRARSEASPHQWSEDQSWSKGNNHCYIKEIVNFVDHLECNKKTQSLFTKDRTIRSQVHKSLSGQNFEKKRDKGGQCSIYAKRSAAKTVVMDAMHVVRRWSNYDDETFVVIARRYNNNILYYVSAGRSIVHLCCMMYNFQSMKS